MITIVFQAVMTLVLMAVVFLLFLKVLWNIYIPYFAWMRQARGGKGSTSTITLMTFTEIGLVLIACVVSLVGGPHAWPLNPLGILLCGSALVLGSYLHMIIFVWVARKFLKARTEGPPPSERWR